MELNIPGKWEADKDLLNVSHQEIIPLNIKSRFFREGN
jgi:hypothetical protein